jgi:hypothetical protein
MIYWGVEIKQVYVNYFLFVFTAVPDMCYIWKAAMPFSGV